MMHLDLPASHFWLQRYQNTIPDNVLVIFFAFLLIEKNKKYKRIVK